MSSPPLVSRHVRLQPIDAVDYAWLHSASCADELALSWRFRGTTPSPEAFVRTLWEGVLSQYLVVGTDPQRRRIGHVSAYNVDFHSGTVYVSATAFPPFLNSGLAIEGCLLFLNYVFSTWRMRKVYFETTDENLAQFRSGLKYLREEGRLKAHEYLKGTYHDRVTLAGYRCDIFELVDRFKSLFPVTFQAEAP